MVRDWTVPATEGSSGRDTPCIVGAGVVSGYGWGRERLWNGLCSGLSAVSPQRSLSEALGQLTYAAVIPDGGNCADGRSRYARASAFAVREAVTDATSRGWVSSGPVGLVLATVLADVEQTVEFYISATGHRRNRDYLPVMPSTMPSMIMTEHGWHGPCMTVTAMCASGNAAVLTAKWWVDAGICSDVVVLAADVSAYPGHLRQFHRLGVLCLDRPGLEACRPFQADSLGYPFGEAAIALIISRTSTGAYSRVLGGAMSFDAYHPASINPDLLALRRAWADALTDSQIDASELRYVNAHGPGTRQCDTAEAALVDTLAVPDLELFSTKPLTGHCQGAAAAVEIAVSALGYDRNLIPAPPIMSYTRAALVNGPSPRKPGATLKSALGLGGYNTAVILDQP